MVRDVGNHHYRVSVLECRGGKTNQGAIAADELLDALKSPLKRWESTEHNPEVLLTFNVKCPRIQTQLLKIDEKSRWEERSAIAGHAKAIIIRDLDQIASRAQLPRFSFLIPM